MYNSEAAGAEVIALLLLVCGGRLSRPSAWHFCGPVILIHLVIALASCWMTGMCTSNLRYVVDDVDVVINRLVLAVRWASCCNACHTLINHSCWLIYSACSPIVSSSCSCVFVIRLVGLLVQLRIQFDSLGCLLLLNLLWSIRVASCWRPLLEITVPWSVYELALMVMSMWHSSLRRQCLLFRPGSGLCLNILNSRHRRLYHSCSWPLHCLNTSSCVV